MKPDTESVQAKVLGDGIDNVDQSRIDEGRKIIKREDGHERVGSGLPDDVLEPRQGIDLVEDGVQTVLGGETEEALYHCTGIASVLGVKNGIGRR